MEPKARKDIFTLIERKDKTYYQKSGVAFRNQDDSWTILLDSLPVGGKLQMRDPSPPRDLAQPLFQEEAAR